MEQDIGIFRQRLDTKNMFGATCGRVLRRVRSGKQCPAAPLLFTKSVRQVVADCNYDMVDAGQGVQASCLSRPCASRSEPPEHRVPIARARAVRGAGPIPRHPPLMWRAAPSSTPFLSPAFSVPLGERCCRR